MIEVALKNRGVSRMLNEHSRQKARRINRKYKDKELRLKKKNNKRKCRRRNNKPINKTSKRRRISADNNPDHSASSSIVDDNVVFFNILCRLPVKSLMRIKCVCKRWKSIIEQDPDFINLHLTHSEMRPGLFLLLPKSAARGGGCATDYESFISTDLHFSGRVANVHTIRRTKSSYLEILGPITGLVCFVDYNCAVRIQNVSTMESTPWMKSTVCTNLEKDNGRVDFFEKPRCYFGFEPTTKQHKAIFVWCAGKFQDFPVCEVLTVGDNKWRIIDEVPPISCNTVGNITRYANGSIYWFKNCRSGASSKLGEAMSFSEDEGMEEYTKWIMAFDIGSEKFRAIPAPKFTVEYCAGKEYEFSIPRFSEVDGCLAVICNLRHICKMWIFHDNKENGASSNEEDWTQVTITLPSNMGEDWSVVFFHPVAGTDQIILETYPDPGYQSSFRRNAKLANFYFYDRKQRTVKKFEVNGISFFPEYSTTACVTTFVESLLPVQKKLQPP